MITCFSVHGAMICVDRQRKTIGCEDVHVEIDMCRTYYRKVGLGAG
jgi:hypothetical protein